MNEKISIIGLGYVGLPVALAFAEKFPNTVGFDVNARRVSSLVEGIDLNNDITEGELNNANLLFTSNKNDLRDTTVFIVTVPTPIDQDRRPDLTFLIDASKIVGEFIKKDSIVVYESTVYPGVTEEICGEVLEQVSGLKCGVDFFLGYSPERINPGDKAHRVKDIVKVVAGQNDLILERVATLYGTIIDAGIHRASSIKVAEAAKVIENTQRDLNIALMNELAIIFDKMNISTRDVLEAAETKWNFLSFKPGLVGGHCIGVDPYYLTAKAEQLGYHPQVILAGRRINDGMGQFIAHRLVKLLMNAGISPKSANVGILGITFKENVSDTRNSKIIEIYKELNEFGINTLVYDPIAIREEVQEHYGISLSRWDELNNLDGLIIAVCHKEFLEMPLAKLISGLNQGGVLIDVKSALSPELLNDKIIYWSL
jgi:UDP-N-acetyl-D-glucosamine/UDP-N-acetyl-D-galactosamine dehydrogenase